MENVVDFEPSRSGKYNWNTIFFVATFHLAALAAFFTFSWQNLAATLIIWWTSKWMIRFLSTLATLGLQSGPIAWTTTHRLHHAFTDQEKDPHSPRVSAWWSHMGWIFQGTAQNQPDSARKRYSPDLMKDPYLVFIDKYYYVTTLILAAGLFAIGGWTMVLWAVVVRVTVSWHFTWGYRRFDTRDDSRNNILVAAVTFGEGWHNNHHAFARSAKHGFTWKEFDINWYQIQLFEKLGLISNVYAYDLKTQSEAPKEVLKAA